MSTTKIAVSGATTAGPPTPGCAPFPSSSCQLNLSVEQTKQLSRQEVRAVNVTAPAFEDLLANTGISFATFVHLRVRSGTLIVRTSDEAGSVDQERALSDLMVYSSPTAGSRLTALAVQGTAEIELLVAGDP